MLTYEPKYVSFETAKLLQEKGFEINSSKYGESKTVALTARKLHHKEKVFYPRPELWVVQTWLRTKYNLHIEVLLIDYKPYNRFYMRCMKIGKYFTLSYDGNDYETYEEALEQGIIYCLNHLL